MNLYINNIFLLACKPSHNDTLRVLVIVVSRWTTAALIVELTQRSFFLFFSSQHRIDAELRFFFFS